MKQRILGLLLAGAVLSGAAGGCSPTARPAASPTAALPAAAQAPAGNNAPNGNSPAAPPAAAAQASRQQIVSGTVDGMSDQGLLLKTQNGPVPVVFGDRTAYHKLESLPASALAAGQSIVAHGLPDENGALAAQMVQVLPDGSLTGTMPGGSQSAAFGTLKQLAGMTLTLTTGEGDRTVTLADATQIQRMSAVGRTDLATGQNVSVAGSLGADGALTAGVITIIVQ